jgi:hypothetical protein
MLLFFSKKMKKRLNGGQKSAFVQRRRAKIRFFNQR